MLESRFGPFDAFMVEYAADVAAVWCEWSTDVRSLEAAERDREHGKGRRPSVAAIRALKKRAGLSRGTYEAALRRLEELSATRTTTESPAVAIARALTQGARSDQ